MKVRTFMPLVAAALIAVLTLALGTGTGSAKTDVKAAPAPYKVALVTDIGGLDDRSFNFLANKGLAEAKTKLKIQGRVFISKSNADYVPNLTAAARGGYNLVISVGFLMGDATAAVAKRFPKTKFAIIDNTGIAKELKGKPTNVRGLLFKEQEAGYLVGYLAGLQSKNVPNSAGVIAAVGGSEDPAGRPVHRRLLPGREGGLPGREGRAQLLPGLRRPGEVQGGGAEPDRERRDGRLPGRGPVRPRRPRRRQGEGRLRHRRRRRPGLPRQHVLTSATKKVDVAVFETIEAAQRPARCEVHDELQRHLHREEQRRRLRQDLLSAQADVEEGPRERPQQIAAGMIKVTATTPPPAYGLRNRVHRKGRVSIPPLPV